MKPSVQAVVIGKNASHDYVSYAKQDTVQLCVFVFLALRFTFWSPVNLDRSHVQSAVMFSSYKYRDMLSTDYIPALDAP